LPDEARRQRRLLRAHRRRGGGHRPDRQQRAETERDQEGPLSFRRAQVLAFLEHAIVRLVDELGGQIDLAQDLADPRPIEAFFSLRGEVRGFFDDLGEIGFVDASRGLGDRTVGRRHDHSVRSSRSREQAATTRRPPVGA
jgi:hypothetical protein